MVRTENRKVKPQGPCHTFPVSGLEKLRMVATQRLNDMMIIIAIIDDDCLATHVFEVGTRK